MIDKIQRRFEQRIVAYAQWVVRWRWLVLITMLTGAVVLASGARFLAFSTDYRVYFGKDNPQLAAFDAVEKIYSKNDNILFSVTPEDGDVFTAETLTAVQELTEAGWQLPFATRVDSITNFQHTEADEDDLIVGDLIEDPGAMSQAQLDRAKRIALSEPLLRNRLISPDADVTGVNVTFNLPGESREETPRTAEAARALVERMEEAYPDLAFHITGAIMLNNAFSEAAILDLKTLIPAMYAMIILVMWLMLRSVAGTLSTLVVIGISAASAMGLAGTLGFSLTPPSAQAPTIIMTLAVADSIHILSTMFALMREGKAKVDALVDALRINFMPVFLTSLTTAIGFLSINFSDSPPLRELGNISAVGVIFAFLYSVTVLPALVAILPMRTPKAAFNLDRSMKAFGEFLVAKRGPILWGSLAVSAAVIALIPRNEFNDQFHAYFDESVEFRTDTDYVIDNLTGFYNIYFDLDTGESQGVSDPEYLRKLERFEEFWKQQPHTLHVLHLGQIMERLNKNMHGDDPDYYRLPDNRELAAQYLLLYELSLPYGLDLTNQVNIDKSGSRFIATFDTISSKETRAYAQAGENWLRENAPNLFTHATSPPVMFSYIAERNMQSMIVGVTLALIGISMLLIFALRSVKMGLISLVPNLVPLGLAFGIWGVYSGQINFTMSFVMGMVLGVIVDNTIHFLSKYLRSRRDQHGTAEDAVRYAMSTVGIAILATNVILISGFLILGQSAFLPNATMSQMTAIAIACALIADFLLLPALLLWLDRDRVNERLEGEDYAAVPVD